MKKFKWIIGILSILTVAAAIVFVLSRDNALLTHPKGIMARRELELIATNVSLMLIIVLPTFIALYCIAWKFRSKARKKEAPPKAFHNRFVVALFWILPALVVAVMSVVTWKAAHELDPYRPLKSDVKPVEIQVVAIDWKWLFIYPEQGIATVNFVQFPAETPINFKLAADGSPMNSFWIPQLSGQIYTMTGMVTLLHIMADEPGVFRGRAAEINGRGFAGMTFTAKASSYDDFNEWVSQVKRSGFELTDPVYDELLKPSENHPVTLYSHFETDLFNRIVMKYL